MHRILITLSIIVGLAPAIASAAPTQDAYPAYVVLLYQETKPLFEQLQAEGYKPECMVVSAYGISATDATGLFPKSETKNIYAFDAAAANGDDTVTLFYQAASYAKEQGDAGMHTLLTTQLARETAVTNEPWWVATVQSATGLVLAGAGLILAMAYMLQPGAGVSEYEQIQRQGMA